MREVDLNALLGAVAVFGAGKSGMGLKSLVKTLGGNSIVFDEKGKGDAVEFREKDVERFKLALYSPGFAQDHVWLQRARRGGIPCYGELDFASIYFDGRIVGVTGTNGKSTLVHLLTEGLKELGKNAFMCGNVGIPLSECVLTNRSLDEIAVCEISSFQAEDLHFLKLDALLWPQFDEDHLDRHGNLENYFRSKWNLVDCLKNERFVFGETVRAHAFQFGIEMPKFGKLVETEKGVNRLKGSVFSYQPQIENFLVAKKYWELMGYNIDILCEVAQKFRGLDHRLKKIDVIYGIRFWNDSKGTNFSAVLAALKNFDKKVVWIGGGKSKGGDIRNFVRNIASKIEMGLLIGETGEKLKGYFKELGVHAQCCKSLEEAVIEGFKYLKENKKVGQDVVLSPGFSSYDMFDNYEDRGKCFEKAVLELKNSI